MAIVWSEFCFNHETNMQIEAGFEFFVSPAEVFNKAGNILGFFVKVKEESDSHGPCTCGGGKTLYPCKSSQ